MSLSRKRQIQKKVLENLRMSGYQAALEQAGAQVLVFEQFGDWQGSWVALVDYQGERGWVQGSFGSCSHCDAFQADFGWDAEDEDDYEERLADFGRSYLGALQSSAALFEQFDQDADWDLESAQAAAYIQHAGQQYGVV
jgi:hypothetical protein